MSITKEICYFFWKARCQIKSKRKKINQSWVLKRSNQNLLFRYLGETICQLMYFLEIEKVERSYLQVESRHFDKKWIFTTEKSWSNQLIFVIWSTVMTVFIDFWTFYESQQNGFLLSIDSNSAMTKSTKKIREFGICGESFEIFGLYLVHL